MDAFWQAATQHDWTQPEIPKEFRVYHDPDGKILFYSMEDLPGDYIVIDRVTFDQCRLDLKVKKGKLVKIIQGASWKMAPAEEADIACHSKDVTVIVNHDSQQKKYWKVITTHEEN